MGWYSPDERCFFQPRSYQCSKNILSQLSCAKAREEIHISEKNCFERLAGGLEQFIAGLDKFEHPAVATFALDHWFLLHRCSEPFRFPPDTMTSLETEM